jgi:hypothetical protein
MDMLTQTRKAVYEAACLAENMFEDELERVYGKDSLKARYDRRLNSATPMLQALKEVKFKTGEAWLLLKKIAREEIAA